MRKSWSLAFELSTLLAFAGVCNAATIETPLRDNVGSGRSRAARNRTISGNPRSGITSSGAP